MIKFCFCAVAKRKLATATKILLTLSIIFTCYVVPARAEQTNDYELVDSLFLEYMEVLGCNSGDNCYYTVEQLEAAGQELISRYDNVSFFDSVSDQHGKVIQGIVNTIVDYITNNTSNTNDEWYSRGGGGGGKLEGLPLPNSYTKPETNTNTDSNGNVIIENNYYQGDTINNTYVTNENINYYENDTIVNEYYNDYYTINNNTYYKTNRTTKNYYITYEYNYYGSIIAVSHTPTHTSLSYVDGGGQTVTNKYYYELSDGRNTYFLTADEVWGEVINYNYINYDTVSENDGTLTLIHFNGDVKDDSFYKNTVSYNGALNYIDSGNFHQALVIPSYTDEEVNLSFSMPSGYSSSSDFTLEYRFYIPNIVQWNPSLNWECHTTKTGGYVVSDYDSTLDSACSATSTYQIDQFNSIKDIDILSLPGIDIKSSKGEIVKNNELFKDSTNVYKYNLTSKGSSIYYGYLLDDKKISFGMWHNVVLINKNGSANVYLDGSLIGSTDSSSILDSFNVIKFSQLQNEVAPYYYLDEIRLSAGDIYGSPDTMINTSNEFDSNKIYVLPDFGGYYSDDYIGSLESKRGFITDDGKVDTTSQEVPYMVYSDYFKVNGLTTYTLYRNSDYDYYIYEYDSNYNLLHKSAKIVEDSISYTTLNNTAYIRYSSFNEFTYSACNKYETAQDAASFESMYLDAKELTDYKVDFSYSIKQTNGSYTNSSGTHLKLYGYYFILTAEFYDSNKNKISSISTTQQSDSLKTVNYTFNFSTPENTKFIKFSSTQGGYFYYANSSGAGFTTSTKTNATVKTASYSNLFEFDCVGEIIDGTVVPLSFKLDAYTIQYHKTELDNGTIALKNDIDMSNSAARFGGVRPTYPSYGQIYFVTSNDRITQVQIFDGSDWVQTGGVIYLNGQWKSLIGVNLLDDNLALDSSQFYDNNKIQECLDDESCDINDIINNNGSGSNADNDNIGDSTTNNTIINVLLGDFLAGLLEGLASLIDVLLDKLIALFVPNPDFFKNIFDGIHLEASNKLGILNVPLVVLDSVIDLFSYSDTVSAVISIPDIHVPGFEEFILFPAAELNFNQLLTDAGLDDFYNFYLSVIDVICYFALFNFARRKWNEVSRR